MSAYVNDFLNLHTNILYQPLISCTVTRRETHYTHVRPNRPLFHTHTLATLMIATFFLPLRPHTHTQLSHRLRRRRVILKAASSSFRVLPPAAGVEGELRPTDRPNPVCVPGSFCMRADT